MSFLTPAKPFGLFRESALSKQIDKRRPIVLHNPRYQGYYIKRRCTRAHQCHSCGDKLAGHSMENCTTKMQCANCCGPFWAGHADLPAAPRRRNGKVEVPIEKELRAIRHFGEGEFTESTTIVRPNTQTPPPISREEETRTPQPNKRQTRDNIDGTQRLQQ